MTNETLGDRVAFGRTDRFANPNRSYGDDELLRNGWHQPAHRKPVLGLIEVTLNSWPILLFADYIGGYPVARVVAATQP